ncbi:MAG: phosphoribosyltransferase, partial [Candidatus Hermodarchaeota archaeon]|nr:phosphoribosyltransferase [Candidatus Hermodarchaeota archaeon]
MFDPYTRYAGEGSLRVPCGKSLTHLALESLLEEYFDRTLSTNSVDFDLTLLEWVSIFELLLLIQWIHRLAVEGKNIKVLFPYTAYLHEIDEDDVEVASRKSRLDAVRRRDRVKSFLCRLGIPKEVKRLLREYPIIFHEGSQVQFSDEIISFDDFQDPFDAKLFPITSFTSQDEIDVVPELSNSQLRTLLEKHSCLDPVDSGMLADVAIEELSSNAVLHGIQFDQGSTNTQQRCAWVCARLVKASWRSHEEVPDWLQDFYRSLSGKHFVELAIIDSGFGVYQHLNRHIPDWLAKKKPTVKAILDYAFDKFSSSVSPFRTQLDTVPRGLFCVYDLVRQYGGLLLIRSGGYYMAYDFLSRNRDRPRILSLDDDQGSCIDVGGTAIQILLPESRGLFLTGSAERVRSSLHRPISFPVDPPNEVQPDIDEYIKGLATDLESMCQYTPQVPVVVDYTALNDQNEEHLYLMARMIRYVLFLENPNILWQLGPENCETIKSINHRLISGSMPSDRRGSILSAERVMEIFDGISEHDRRICPMLLPTGEVIWLGATEQESRFLGTLWGGGEIGLSDFGENTQDVIRMARANRHIVSLISTKGTETEDRISLRIGLFEFSHDVASMLSETAQIMVRTTPGTIQRNGCYHLPHGEYSNEYVYLKPLLSNTHVTRRLARFLLTKLSLTQDLADIDIVVGGTHSAKRLILCVAKQLNAETLTIARYSEQIDLPSISEIVAGKQALITSDVISSGAFVSRLASRLSDAGCHVKAIATLCDLRTEAHDHLSVEGPPVMSLFTHRIRKFRTPNRSPVYEVNPISLRPTLLSKERERRKVPSLLETEEFINWANRSHSVVPGHIVLGPTHYTYFVDTGQLLSHYAEDFFDKVLEDITEQLQERGRPFEEDSINFLVTPEGSNAELYFPGLWQKHSPGTKWIQIDRIRLSKEGVWQLDSLDPNFVPVDRLKGSTVLVWDDGSNTGGTLMQLLEIVSEYEPELILAYCLVNRLPANRSLFLSRCTELGKSSQLSIRFVTSIPVGTFIRSNCPICNRRKVNIPPVAEIEQYWETEEVFLQEYGWNHISAPAIADSVGQGFAVREVKNTESFLSKVFYVRCLFGNFEDKVGVTEEEREQLMDLLKDRKSLGATCFVLNREPQLLDSVVRFQLPGFEDELLKAVVLFFKTAGEVDYVGVRDIIQFISERHPEIVIEHFKDIADGLLTSASLCIALISRMVYTADLATAIQTLQELCSRISEITVTHPQRTLLESLCSTALSWLRLEREQTISEDLHGAILDLQAFYTPTETRHEGALEYG